MKAITLVFIVSLYFHPLQIIYTERTKNLTEKVLQKFFSTHENGTLMDNIKFDINQSLLDSEKKGRFCLKNISKCERMDNEYQKTGETITSFMFSTMPPLDFSKIEGVSTTCRHDSRIYIQNLRRFKMWALKMYDSTAKIPSGLLNGNVNQLGDFDLCVTAQSDNQKINGKYCLASFQVQTPHSPYLSALHTLFQSHSHFKSQLDDPGHRVPRFSSIHWALCVPSSCSFQDIEAAMKKKVDGFVKNTDLEVDVKVHSDLCRSHQIEPTYPKSTIIAAAVFLSLICLEIFATIYDYYAIGEKNDWILSFSLRKNFNQIMSTKKSADEIEAIHGIRFMNAVLLLIAHKSMAVFFTPYTNRTEMVEYLTKPWTVISRAASLYTDPFIMMSGTLTTYAFLKKLKRDNKINIASEYISRLFRILPTFAALIAFCTLILPWINSGPLWNLVVTRHSDICKKYWWRNLLFIHNYFGFENMCLTHTHHVGIDTQLFFVAPFLVLILWKWPKKGGGFLIGLALFSTFLRYYVSYTMKLSNYIHYGTSIKQLFDTADNMYILPLHRLTVYIIGVFLGYVLSYSKNITLSKAQIRLGNTCALLSFLASFIGPAFMGTLDYKYNPTDAAWYAAFSPILWCFSFAWIIFATHIGYKGIFGSIFSWPKFMIWTKISYTVYLTQFPVYFYNVGTARAAEQFGFFKNMFPLKEFAWVIFSAILLTLVIELPFQNIKNILFTKRLLSRRKKES